jgi:hypothetical protein
MKRIATFALALMCLAAACGRESPQGPRNESRLQVYVHWQDHGLADKRLEIVELALEKVTNASGNAEFVLLPGTYTLRAYGINRGGMPPAYVDNTVQMMMGETTRVEVVDCVPCVAPSPPPK